MIHLIKRLLILAIVLCGTNAQSQPVPIQVSIVDGESISTGEVIYYNYETLSSQNTIISNTANVIFKSSQRVRLLPGFRATNFVSGGKFKAFIDEYQAILPVSYAELSKKLDGGYSMLTAENKLYFKYTGEYIDKELNYTIYNSSRADVTSSCTLLNLSNYTNPPINKYGDNRYEMDCASLTTGYYTLEIKNEKGELYLLRFKK